ncbi:MAG TPA: glycosyltransferase [Chthoniobacteraceae bacterium]
MKKPSVSVLMSVHNGGRWLRPAIDSVLAQTRWDFEFIILDDASTDDSAEQISAVGDARIRLIRLPENIGLTRSLNFGLREARGRFVARQDADDLSDPCRLEKQLAFLQRHPEVALVGAQARLIDAEGRSRGVRNLPLEPASLRWLSLLDNPVIHTAATFRTAVVRDEFGGYDESFSCCQDYALWMKVMGKYDVANLPARLVSVREHGASVSATRRSEAQVLVERVVRETVNARFPALASEEAFTRLLCAFRRHLTPDEVQPFHEALAQLETAIEQHQQSSPRGSADLRRTRAQLFARIAYNLLAEDRVQAAAELVRAINAWPKVALELPWLRMLGLFLMGDAARRWFARAREGLGR